VVFLASLTESTWELQRDAFVELVFDSITRKASVVLHSPSSIHNEDTSPSSSPSVIYMTPIFSYMELLLVTCCHRIARVNLINLTSGPIDAHEWDGCQGTTLHRSYSNNSLEWSRIWEDRVKRAFTGGDSYSNFLRYAIDPTTNSPVIESALR